MPSKILVPVRDDGMIETVLRHAGALAINCTAHIVATHCRAPAEKLMPYGVQLPSFARQTLTEQARELADQEEQGAREEVQALATSLGLTPSTVPLADAASIDFVEEDGLMPEIIKRAGRLADLVVVAKPDRDRNLGTNSLKAALFRTGRPVLMCPPDRAVAHDLGRHIAVAWNGSLEAARAVAMTRDLAQAAETVTILSGGKDKPQGANSDGLVSYYQMHGITANIHRFKAEKPGDELLQEATKSGASMLIMGAYGQNHERETLFGGNTQGVVDKADMPVVFVH